MYIIMTVQNLLKSCNPSELLWNFKQQWEFKPWVTEFLNNLSFTIRKGYKL